VSGGGLFQLKGIPQDSAPRRMSVWLHEERSSVFRLELRTSALCLLRIDSRSRSSTAL
jgi:hypothetical protein